MHVRHRDELVTLRLEDDIDPNELTGRYLEPKEFYEAMQQEDTIVVDARNDYEYDLGHFRGAIRPDIKAFRELPEWIQNNKEKLEGKKILTYCTGGIRCEKFSGWLKKKGLKMCPSFTAASSPTGKILRSRASCGTANAMSLMKESAFP